MVATGYYLPGQLGEGSQCGRRDSNLIEKGRGEKTLGMVGGKYKRDKNSPPPPSQGDLQAGDGGGQPLIHRLTGGVLQAWPTG